jgi:hypothetical protein
MTSFPHRRQIEVPHFAGCFFCFDCRRLRRSGLVPNCCQLRRRFQHCAQARHGERGDKADAADIAERGERDAPHAKGDAVGDRELDGRSRARHGDEGDGGIQQPGGKFHGFLL